MYNQEYFIKVVQDSYKIAENTSPRSDKKLEPLYDYFKKILKNIWGDDSIVEVKSKIKGKYFDKTINLVVKRQNKPVFCMDVILSLSNYSQNYHNLLEKIMGNAANVQSYGKIPFVQILILKNKAPKNQEGSVEKYEMLKDKDLEKFININCGIKQVHIPFATGILIVDIDKENDNVTKTDMGSIFSENIVYFLENKLSIENALNEINDYQKLYSLENGLMI